MKRLVLFALALQTLRRCELIGRFLLSASNSQFLREVGEIGRMFHLSPSTKLPDGSRQRQHPTKLRNTKASTHAGATVTGAGGTWRPARLSAWCGPFGPLSCTLIRTLKWDSVAHNRYSLHT
jgi:hypothetical protein